MTHIFKENYSSVYSQQNTWQLKPSRMLADAQRDGRPAEYSWRPLRQFRNFLVPRRKLWLTPTARVPCSNAANIGER